MKEAATACAHCPYKGYFRLFPPVLHYAFVDGEEHEQDAQQGKDGEYYNWKVDQVDHFNLQVVVGLSGAF